MLNKLNTSKTMKKVGILATVLLTYPGKSCMLWYLLVVWPRPLPLISARMWQAALLDNECWWNCATIFCVNSMGPTFISEAPCHTNKTLLQYHIKHTNNISPDSKHHMNITMVWCRPRYMRCCTLRMDCPLLDCPISVLLAELVTRYQVRYST